MQGMKCEKRIAGRFSAKRPLLIQDLGSLKLSKHIFQKSYETDRVMATFLSHYIQIRSRIELKKTWVFDRGKGDRGGAKTEKEGESKNKAEVDSETQKAVDIE